MESSIYEHLRQLRDETPGALGERIRARRLALRLTQAELGSPLSQSHVSAIERGRSRPSLHALWLIAGRLGVSVEALVGPDAPIAIARNPRAWGPLSVPPSGLDDERSTTPTGRL